MPSATLEGGKAAAASGDALPQLPAEEPLSTQGRGASALITPKADQKSHHPPSLPHHRGNRDSVQAEIVATPEPPTPQTVASA